MPYSLVYEGMKPLSFICSDLIKLQSGLGDKWGMAIQALAMFVSGFGIGFYFSWELTLVILAVTPLLVIVGGIFGKIMGNTASAEQSAYAEAGGIAEEAFSSIRTVVAFGGEHDTIEKYVMLIHDSIFVTQFSDCIFILSYLDF